MLEDLSGGKVCGGLYLSMITSRSMVSAYMVSILA